jgi:hypothetical protein
VIVKPDSELHPLVVRRLAVGNSTLDNVGRG